MTTPPSSVQGKWLEKRLWSLCLELYDENGGDWDWDVRADAHVDRKGNQSFVIEHHDTKAWWSVRVEL